MKNTVPNEIELKMMFEPQHQRHLSQWLDQQKVIQKATEMLGNTYFDTPDQFFAKQQMGLRVRNKNNQFELTLKTKGEIKDGLHIRPEYNLAIDENKPFFTKLNQQFDLGFENAEEIEANLIPTFSTDFTRQKWLIEFNQSQIEVAMDQGLIKNQYGEEAICELELELLGGEISAIFCFFEGLPFKDGMWLSNLSKAQRGYLVGQTDKWAERLLKEIAQDEDKIAQQKLADFLRSVEFSKVNPLILDFVIKIFNEKDLDKLKVFLKSYNYLKQVLKSLINPR